MKLPTIKSDDKEFQLMQDKWSSIINPVLANPLTKTNILKDIQLGTGVNVINHLLGRMMQGWYVTDIDASVSIFRSQPFNNSTLTLTSSGACTINLAVF